MWVDLTLMLIASIKILDTMHSRNIGKHGERDPCHFMSPKAWFALWYIMVFYRCFGNFFV